MRNRSRKEAILPSPLLWGMVACLLALTAAPALADERFIVLKGTPSYKVEATSEGPVEKKLTPGEQQEFRVIITKKGDRYYWETREGKAVIPSQNEEFINFFALDGTGYVKITVLDNVYMEHVHYGLKTITYWGEVKELNWKENQHILE